jgi:hypothetical protein
MSNAVSSSVVTLCATATGAALYVQLNCVAAVLLFPAASVKALEATSMVTTPPPVGVSVAVYEVPLPVKPLNVPLVTVMSVSAKSAAVSESVKVIGNVLSLLVEPLARAA